MLKPVEISPTAKVPNEIFLSNSIELWLLEDITQAYPLKTNGWNLKIHPKQKGETSTTQIPPNFLGASSRSCPKINGFIFLYLLGGLFFRKFPSPFPSAFLGEVVSCFQVTVLSQGRLMLLVPGQCSLPFWSETWTIFLVAIRWENWGKTGGWFFWLQRTTGWQFFVTFFGESKGHFESPGSWIVGFRIFFVWDHLDLFWMSDFFLFLTCWYIFSFWYGRLD